MQCTTYISTLKKNSKRLKQQKNKILKYENSNI